MKIRRQAFSLTLALLGTASFGAVTSVSAAVLECDAVPYIMKAYFQNHYEHQKLTDSIKRQTVEQFIKALDPSKTMLLAEDVEQIRKDLPKIFSTMNEGNCHKLNDIYGVLVKRVKETEASVRKTLDKSYKLDESAELILDSDKRQYAKNQQEKEKVLTQMIHFQMSNYLLDGIKLEEAKKQLIHRYELITKRTLERKGEDHLVNYLEAFAQGLDPHSTFFSRDNLEDFEIQMRLSLEGIGASLSSQDGYTVIEQIIPGGGADRIGTLKPKDKIIAVAQDKKTPVSIIDMDLRDVVKMIRGKKGTKVKLTVLRQGDEVKRFDVTIVRDKIDLKDQAAKISYETRKVGDRDAKIGVIELPSFYGGGGKNGRSSYADVKKLLNEAKAKKVDGIVLDLSRNGGGLLDDAVKLAGLFIRKGAVVATQTTDGKVEPLYDEDEDVVYSGPLAILTSRFSASASEILAGALRDYGRAVVIGNDHTFGKGTVQVMIGMPANLGALKVTTGMYFLPRGQSTQHTGVQADVVLPYGFDESSNVGEKHLDYSLSPRKIAPFLSQGANSTKKGEHWEPISADVIAKLASKSKDRVEKNPKFAELKVSLEKANQRKGLVKLADIRKELIAEKKKDSKSKKSKSGKKAAKKAAKEDTDGEDENPLFLQESLDVLADLITLQNPIQTQGVPVKIGSKEARNSVPKKSN